jgi:potassium-dependent mechanosensitive channel
MQLHIKKAILLFCLLSFYLSCGLAFEPKEANKNLDKITISLSGKELHLNVLNNASAEIMELKKNAEKCVKENSDQLTELTAQLPELDPNQNTITKEQMHFFEKKSKTEDRVSECKLFILRANESLATLTEQSKQLKRNIILTPHPPLWADILNYPVFLSAWAHELRWSQVKKISSLDTYAPTEILFFILFSGFIYLLSRFVQKRSLLALKKNNDNKSDGQLLYDRFFTLYFKRSNYLYFFFLLFGYTSIHDLHYDLDYLLNDIFLGICAFILINILFEYLFLPFKHGGWIFKVPKRRARYIITSMKIYLGICLLGLLGLNFKELFVEELFYTLTSALYYTALSIAFMSVLYNTLLSSKFLEKSERLKTYCLSFSAVFFFVLIYLRWYGFEGLSGYILKGLMLTYWGALFSYLLFKLSIWVIDCFSGESKINTLKMFKVFNLQKDSILLEMIIMKVVVFLLIWGGFIVFLNEFWSFSELWSIKVREIFITGFNIAGANVVPIRIIGGLAFFALLVLFIKILKHLFHSRDQLTFNAAEEAYVIILGYFGYATILVFSLLIAGVNMQGLAIIAGALSVGIGFGLQGIVNNFVSGLVLLLERPIKRGDRIIVGDKEGFVADIGIRSTRINTLNQADVMIPNADLVSQNVLNYMYNNKKTRITISLEVEHGTEPERVRELLLKAAKENKAVIQSESDEPIVYFSGFTNYSLKFDLWCSVENVNFLFKTKSELHQQINTLFKEDGIKLAYQQLDLHIKDPLPYDIDKLKPKED